MQKDIEHDGSWADGEQLSKTRVRDSPRQPLVYKEYKTT